MTTLPETHTVAVYGSLLSGLHNHTALTSFGSKLLGPATISGLKMYDLGSFPGVVVGSGGAPIKVEVYEVSDACLDRLDRLEGEPDFYKRTRMMARMEGGGLKAVFVYLYRGTGYTVVESGDWKAHYLARSGRVSAV